MVKCWTCPDLRFLCYHRFGQYKDVLILDFLTCRLPHDCPELLLKPSLPDRDRDRGANGNAPSPAIPTEQPPRRPIPTDSRDDPSKGFVQPLRNAMDHAHVSTRRVGLVALPMSTLMLCEVLIDVHLTTGGWGM